nr:MAG TPA: hypothetical protein [Herelleviridae sp.]
MYDSLPFSTITFFNDIRLFPVAPPKVYQSIISTLLGIVIDSKETHSFKFSYPSLLILVNDKTCRFLIFRFPANIVPMGLKRCSNVVLIPSGLSFKTSQ